MEAVRLLLFALVHVAAGLGVVLSMYWSRLRRHMPMPFVADFMDLLGP